MLGNRILRDRVAGQSAMSAVVAAQAAAPARSRISRFFGLRPLTEESRLNYRGALGELLVGDVLENLGPSWDVLHDLPLDTTVLDHLIIGRAGVFTVRTANFGREDVHVDGDRIVVGTDIHQDITCARDEAAEVARVLGAATGLTVKVRPLFVVVDPRRLFVRAPSAGVRVISSLELERVLTRAPRTLTGDEVARLSDVADLVATWPAGDAVDVDGSQLNRDFGVIRSQVREALVRRVAWIVFGAVIVYSALFGTIATLVSIMMQR